MRKTKWISVLGCAAMSVCMMASSVLPVFAAEEKGTGSSLAGISAVLNDFIEYSDEGEEVLSSFVLSNGNESGTVSSVSYFNNMAISKVEDYVNIRQEPTTDSEILGKMYDQCGATILSTTSQPDGDWYHIRSGSVDGYIKAEFFVTGSEAREYARQNGTLYMSITEDGINVREEANTNCDVLTVLYSGDSCSVIGEENGFIKLTLEDGTEGYVSEEFASVYVNCDTAISLEEEQAMLEEMARREEEERLRKEAEAEAQARAEAEAARRRQEAAEWEAQQREAERRAAEEAAAAAAAAAAYEEQYYYEEPVYEEPYYEEPVYEEPYYEEPAYEEPAYEEPVYEDYSGGRSAVVDYCWSKVGCEYVWGAEGPWSFDCSGLVKCAYAQAGVYLYHQSGSQGSAGEWRSVGDAQPGDILWKSGHVGIYVGDGLCIHASNYGVGVIVSNVWDCGWVCARNVLG